MTSIFALNYAYDGLSVFFGSDFRTIIKIQGIYAAAAAAAGT